MKIARITVAGIKAAIIAIVAAVNSQGLSLEREIIVIAANPRNMD